MADHEDYLPGEAPTAHKVSHQDGGTDEISVAGLSGELADDQPPKAHDLAGDKHVADTLANLNTKVTDATLDDEGDSRDPNAHAAGHENGGADEISVAGLSGELADDQPPKAHDLGGDKHSADTLANLNAKVTDATLLDDDAINVLAGLLITAHKNIPTAHQDAPALILTHKGDASAHHAKYTDLEAIAGIRTDNIIMALNKYFKGLIEIIGNPALQNMLMNGGFEETDGTDAYYWISGAGITTETSGGDDSNKYLKCVRSGGNKTSEPCNPDGLIRWFEVNEGETYELGCSGKSDGTCTWQMGIGVYDKDKANPAWLTVNGTEVAWTTKSTTYTIPAGKKFLYLFVGAYNVDGWAAFDNVYLKRVDEKAWSFTHASDRTKIDVAKLHDVTYGVNDSGGEGYKLLRVPN